MIEKTFSSLASKKFQQPPNFMLKFDLGSSSIEIGTRSLPQSQRAEILDSSKTSLYSRQVDFLRVRIVDDPLQRVEDLRIDIINQMLRRNYQKGFDRSAALMDLVQSGTPRFIRDHVIDSLLEILETFSGNFLNESEGFFQIKILEKIIITQLFLDPLNDYLMFMHKGCIEGILNLLQYFAEKRFLLHEIDYDSLIAAIEPLQSDRYSDLKVNAIKILKNFIE